MYRRRPRRRHGPHTQDAGRRFRLSRCFAYVLTARPVAVRLQWPCGTSRGAWPQSLLKRIVRLEGMRLAGADDACVSQRIGGLDADHLLVAIRREIR